MVQRGKVSGDPSDPNQAGEAVGFDGSHAGGGGTGLSADVSKPFPYIVRQALSSAEIDDLLSCRPGDVFFIKGALPRIDSAVSLAVGIPVSCADSKKIANGILG